MLTYSALLRRLFQINSSKGMKQGLSNCKQLQAHFNFPDQDYHTIHVAGTNGKGSVSLKIGIALQHAGYKVGIFTSPHVSSFRERIKINGDMIPEEDLADILQTLFKVIDQEEIPATFFELATFAAYLYFARQKVDFAVFEVGLGGRLDATNIITPLLSIITSISLDHTELLGQSVNEIAREKAGIIKPGIPVVIGPHTPQDFFKKIAHQYNCPYIAIDNTFTLYEEENKAIARTALHYLSASFPLSDHSIEKGLNASLPCRLEVACQSPLVIMDVAHNPDGLEHLFFALNVKYPLANLRIVFGLSKTKDIEGCLHILQKHGHFFHLVEAANGRGATINQLKMFFHQKLENVFSHCSVTQGVEQAVNAARLSGDLVVICGTFFIMSEARKALGIIEPQDEIDMNESNISCKSRSIDAI
ncbi:MAG: bifunctional folylpolyglutamate synthase/dihydrofolate synthase [Parachlamydia sp.]|jgi:dihydrofolate synthase/folylpolyglutamate synthase|nr:bifunctional folylpolyglutamate synthase/dihydrofolate synthase [Parachlamydia sp.]